MPLLGSLLLIVTSIWHAPDVKLPGQGVGDFEASECKGQIHRLSDWRHSRLLVVVFIGVNCPLAELYAPRLIALAEEFASQGVAFVAIDSNEQDSLAEIGRYATVHRIRFPILKDSEQKIVRRLGATRTPEAFVLAYQDLTQPPSLAARCRIAAGRIETRLGLAVLVAGVGALVLVGRILRKPS